MDVFAAHRARQQVRKINSYPQVFNPLWTGLLLCWRFNPVVGGCYGSPRKMPVYSDRTMKLIEKSSISHLLQVHQHNRALIDRKLSMVLSHHLRSTPFGKRGAAMVTGSCRTWEAVTHLCRWV